MGDQYKDKISLKKISFRKKQNKTNKQENFQLSLEQLTQPIFQIPNLRSVCLKIAIN